MAQLHENSVDLLVFVEYSSYKWTKVVLELLSLELFLLLFAVQVAVFWLRVIFKL